MTKEEYQRNIVRMWDSIRSTHKGEKNCSAVNCRDCPFDGKLCNIGEKAFRVYEAIEVVENWTKEHPIVTNADKFREVFGFEPNVFTDNEKHILCNGYRTMDEKFWNAEYKPTKEGEEE